MKCEIREVCGDWALDLIFSDETITIYFNSRKNVENVKRIIETDLSIPNAATVCDMQEVVRCKDCKYWEAVKNPKHKDVGICVPPRKDIDGCCVIRGATNNEDFCSQGVKK